MSASLGNIVRVIYCLSGDDIEKAFDNDLHLIRKFEASKKEFGGLGPFKFVMSLDSSNIKKLESFINKRATFIDNLRVD